MRPSRTTLIGAALCCATFLAGCGDASDDTAPPSTTSPAAGDTAPTTTAEASFPVTITHAYGTTKLDRAPTRVITLGWIESDVVAALGVDPVAVSSFPFAESGLTPWFTPEVTTKPELLSTAAAGTSRSELNLERILALRPDLIIANTYIDLESQYGKLTQIAPTLGPLQKDYAHMPWADHVTSIGTALGKAEEAKQLVAKTEKGVTDAIAAHPQLKGKTYTLALGVPGSLRLVQDEKDSGIQLLARFGMSVNPRITKLASLGDGSGGAAVSAETVDNIDADLVVIAYTTPAAKQEWESSPLFKAVPAIAAGRYLAVDTTALTALRNQSPLSLPYAVKQILSDGAAAKLR